MSDGTPRNTDNKADGGQHGRDAANGTEPLIVTIEPQSRKSDSYEAKAYRLERAKYRLEKKAHRVGYWTMLFLLIYTGLTLIVAISSIIATVYSKRSADSEVAANRAWIVPDFPPQHKRVIEEANLEWHNAGKTPAIAVSSWKEYFTGEIPKTTRNCSEMERVARAQPQVSRQYQAFVSEGGRYEIGLDQAPPWTGQQPIYIHGCIWFTDISSNTEKSSEFFYIAFQNKFGTPSSDDISLFFDRPFTYN